MKKITALLLTLALLVVPTNISYARSEEFMQAYNSLLEEFSSVEYNDENTSSMLEIFETCFSDFANLQQWPSEEYELTILSGVMACFCYLDTYCEEETKGYVIAQAGLDAVEALFLSDGTFNDKIKTLADVYKTETGVALYSNAIQEGQHKIGDDMQSGEYVLFSDYGSGYFCVSSDSNGTDIIANDNFEYNSIITVNDGEYLELSRCYAVPLVEVTELPIDKANMFLVGTHLPAGEYCLESDESGYYCIYEDSRHNNIITNGNFEGQSYVSVSDGQYLLLSRRKIKQ